MLGSVTVSRDGEYRNNILVMMMFLGFGWSFVSANDSFELVNCPLLTSKGNDPFGLYSVVQSSSFMSRSVWGVVMLIRYRSPTFCCKCLWWCDYIYIRPSVLAQGYRSFMQLSSDLSHCHAFHYARCFVRFIYTFSWYKCCVAVVTELFVLENASLRRLWLSIS